MGNLKARINEKLTDLFPLMRGRKNALVLPTDGRLDNGISRWQRKKFYLDTGDGETWLGREKPSVVGATDRQDDAAVHSPEEVLFGGTMMPHFGHFLCESISRLWALDKLGSEIPIVYGCKDRAALEFGRESLIHGVAPVPVRVCVRSSAVPPDPSAGGRGSPLRSARFPSRAAPA